MTQEHSPTTTKNANITNQHDELDRALKNIEERGWEIATRYADNTLQDSTFIPAGKAEIFRRRCREDILYHLEYLISAMRTGTPEVFSNYVGWLQEVLAHRDVVPGCLEPSLQYLEEEVRPLVPDANIPLFETILLSGRHASRDFKKKKEKKPELLLSEPSRMFVEALLDANRAQAQGIVSENVENARSLFGSLSKIVAPSMYQIGLLWQHNRISVTEEHVATGITNHAIRNAYSQLQKPPASKKKVILACVEGNQHSMGLEMVSWVFEMAGWESIFLGANAPTEALMTMIDRQQPDGIGLSVSTGQQMRAALQICEQVRANFHTHMPAIVLGGYVFHAVPELRRLPRADAILLDVAQLSTMVGTHTGETTRM